MFTCVAEERFISHPFVFCSSLFYSELIRLNHSIGIEYIRLESGIAFYSVIYTVDFTLWFESIIGTKIKIIVGGEM